MEKTKVLIVEDNYDFAMLCSYTLNRAGFATTQAHSAEEALRHLKENQPDVIVMDLTLPDLTAQVFLEKIRSDLKMAKTPIIVASGQHNLKEVSEQLNCQGFLLKPFDFKLLVKKVSELFVPNTTS